MKITNYLGIAIVALAVIAATGYAQYGYSTTSTTTIANTMSNTITANTMNTSTTTTTNVTSVNPLANTLPTNGMRVLSITPSMINASGTGATVLTINSNSVDMKVTVNPGTYAMVNGNTLSMYNFSVILFDATNVGVPSNAYTSTNWAFGFAVNGMITPSIQLVDANGVANPPTTVIYNQSANTTSFGFFGGNFTGTSYNGGSYAPSSDTWQQNGTTITNTQFSVPVIWVVLNAVPTTTTPTTTSINTTVNSTTVPYSTPTTTIYTAPTSSTGILQKISNAWNGFVAWLKKL
jgi:hypothetical protein